MVTVTKTDTRADIAECMANLTKTTASLKRRGHEGTHKSCEDCDRYAVIHANLNALITSWERAPR